LIPPEERSVATSAFIRTHHTMRNALTMSYVKLVLVRVVYPAESL
jgi:hypothetical protein